MPAWERDLREKLKTPVTVEFRETGLAEACETLGKLAGVKIYMDPALAAQGMPITLPKCTMTAESVLKWIARFARGRYVFRDWVVLIVRLPPPGKLQTCYYDISDLLRPLSSPQGKEREESIDEAAGQGWCRYIRAVIAPGTWDEVAASEVTCQIFFRNGRLVVVNLEAVQKEVAALLDALRKMRDRQVHFNARFVAIDRVSLDALKLNLKWQGSGGSSASYAHLSQDELTALLEAVVKKRKGTVISAPRATCYNTQRANFQVLTNYSYIRRFAEDGTEIGNEAEGLVFDVQPFVSPDQKHISLVVEGQLRMRHAAPVLLRLDGVLTLPDAGSVLFAFSPAAPERHGSKDKTALAVVLTPEIVRDFSFEE
ncbi:MAG TPA: hypothetical protein VNE39_02565 [Planctomycetota bacterium]|nr:hypothetical protein [Planctomycetota bacterium]